MFHVHRPRGLRALIVWATQKAVNDFPEPILGLKQLSVMSEMPVTLSDVFAFK